MSKPAVTIVVTEVIMNDDVYFSAFNAETGEKVAPWTDADTPEEVMARLLSGKTPE